MNSNLVICRNAIYIEDVYVGQFESFEMQASRESLGSTAVLTIPLYGLGVVNSGEASSRMRTVFKNTILKPCAQVRVECWYEGMERVTVFEGFIEHIGEGFPSKLYLQDNSFILRFGSIQKGWAGNVTVQNIVNECIPIAMDGFNKERKKNGFTRTIPTLTYSTEKKNVQAKTTPISMRNWGGKSPYDTVQKLMSDLVLYGGVSDDFNVFVGAGVEKSTRPIIPLDTRYNVIERDLVPQDGRFIDFDVKVVGTLTNGKRVTAIGGYGIVREGADLPERAAGGESFKGYSSLQTESGIKDFADRMLAMLKGVRNKGTIKLLLYPKAQILDWVSYNDTLFPQLSTGYYVTGYRFAADDKGYFQTLEVTDQIYSL